MGASSIASVARASPGAPAGASASPRSAAPAVNGLPAFMTVTSGGKAQGQIEAMKQQEQTEDRSVAEDLADRIGQTDARKTMQAEDARQAAKTAAAQENQSVVKDVAEDSHEAVSRAQAPEEAVSRADAGDGLVGPGGAPAKSGGEQTSEEDGEAQDGAGGGASGGGGAGGRGGGNAEGGGKGAADAGTGGPGTAGADGAKGDGASGGAGGGKSGADGPAAEDVPRDGGPAQAPDTDAGALGTDDLVLIDVEIAEHQRWAAAAHEVGAAGSMERAEFIAQTAGGAFIGGVASGAAMGLEMGLISRAVPQLGAIMGGKQALDSLLERDWDATGATIGKFGKGSDVYDTLANTLASVNEVITIANNICDYIGGIVAVVEVAAIAVAAGSAVLAFFTFGATAGIAIEAGELADVCEEIREAVGEVSTILNEISNHLLQPCILLFRALHEFTADADPREIEAGGHELSGAAGAVGGALGGWIGGQAAKIGGHAPPNEGEGTQQRPPHETPLAPEGLAPEVHFQEPPAPVAPVEASAASGTSASSEIPAVPEVPAASSSPGGEAPFYGVTDTAGPGPSTTPEAPTSTTSPAPPPESPAASTGEPTQLDLPNVPQKAERVPRAQTPDEIAPANTRSAYLRRLRAEAAGTEASLRPDPEPYNIARHRPPSARGTARDLYQPSPRPAPEDGYVVQESHHLEHQEYQRGDAENPGIANYRANEDSTIDLPVDEHHALRAPQSAMETAAQSPTTRVELGRAASIEQATNLIQYGQLTPPPPGTPNRVPEGVAGQLAMEHMGYLFSLSPVQSGPTEVTPPLNGIPGMQGPVRAGDVLPSPAHRHPGRPNALARDTLPEFIGPSTPPEWNHDDAVWDRTLNDSFGPAPEPPPAAPAATQLELPLGPSADGPAGPLMPVSEGSGGDTGRNKAPLTPEQRQQMEDAALHYGASPGSLLHTDTATGYDPSGKRVHLGPDAFPLPPEQRSGEGPNPANARLSMKAAVAHEVIGHQEAALGGATRDAPWHEEVQASARAALHADDLSPEERWDALQDAAARRRGQTDDTIFVDTERYGPAAEAQRKSAASSGDSGDHEAKVIIDPSLYEPAPESPARQSVAPPTESPPLPATPAPPKAPAPLAPRASTAHGGGEAAAPPSLGSRVAKLFFPQESGGEGKAPTYAEQQAAHRAEFTDDNQPAAGVERVNPHYSSPPGTPDQIVVLQNEILNLLAVRARAEAESQHEGQRIEACEANRAPITATLATTHGGLSAVRAHEQAVARHNAANLAQQQRQQEAAAKTGGYADKAAGMGVIEAPLAAWEGFTSLASHLPGSAGDKMAAMNAEAKKMQDAFGQMGAHMLGADGDQPARAASLADDSARIDATDAQAQASHQDLQSSADGAAGLQSANNETLAAAQQRQQLADKRSEELQSAADDRQASADSLAAQMQAWAQAHRDERTQAVAATVARLQAQGKIVTQSPTE